MLISTSFQKIGRRLVCLVLLMLVLAFSAPAFAQEDTSKGIVVWKLTANKGVTKADVNLISNFVTTLVAKVSGAKVISESDILTILKGARTRQQCGVDDTSCMAEIGAALGVPEAVSGDIGKIGSFWMLNLRRINVRTAEVVARSSRSIEGSVDDLIRALPGAVGELFLGETAPVVTAPKPEPVATGKLSVTSIPEGATVLLGDKTLGQTPLEIDLPAAEYTITVEYDGYASHDTTLRVLPGETTVVQSELEMIPPGRIEVSSDPGEAEVYLGGESLGKTPLKKKLPPGEHLLVLKLDGYKTTKQSVSVQSGESANVAVTLERAYPMNPYKKYGYVSFFTGLGLAAFGGIASWQASAQADSYHNATTLNAANDAKSANAAWSGTAITGYTIGGALMVTGVVLWALSPGDQAWWEAHQVSVAPTADGSGGAITLGGRW